MASGVRANGGLARLVAVAGVSAEAGAPGAGAGAPGAGEGAPGEGAGEGAGGGEGGREEAGTAGAPGGGAADARRVAYEEADIGRGDASGLAALEALESALDDFDDDFDDSAAAGNTEPGAEIADEALDKWLRLGAEVRVGAIQRPPPAPAPAQPVELSSTLAELWGTQYDPVAAGKLVMEHEAREAARDPRAEAQQSAPAAAPSARPTAAPPPSARRTAAPPPSARPTAGATAAAATAGHGDGERTFADEIFAMAAAEMVPTRTDAKAPTQQRRQQQAAAKDLTEI